MTLEEIVPSSRLRALAREGPLAPYLDGFVSSVASIGFTRMSLREVVVGAIHFGAFLGARGLTDIRTLRTADLRAFVNTQPLYLRQGKYRQRISRGMRGMRHALRYLREAEILAPPSAPPAPIFAPLLDEWLAFLERHRGLARKSLDLYCRHITRFLESVSPDATAERLRWLTPDRVRDYVLSHAPGRSRSERKALVSTLRIFLRFGWDRGYLDRDLALVVERVPSFKEDRLPRGPRWKDALKLLKAPDRTTALGRRDYAILLAFLTYGVRAGQVCALRLDDVDWREATIRFAAAKGGRSIDLPLLPHVGKALVAYLRRGRPRVSHRNVFLSTDPPFAGLTTSGIYGVVSKAFRRAGVTSPHYGSHALRHTWATRMLHRDRPLKTLADLLGHRSIETTRIYAKVDYARLRDVGLSWPGEQAQ